ncbi:hypothetical protein N3K66_003155 [Trichothecium roseum]|uniref:Uncharacterized protein n=1 Tax=Trichothecium roseum TaxID=47278 RepID=A0ACC0V4W6_9HYPO|nr:hypothetical protein N3K66_003155 [Trichothecium roseum]
MVKDNIALDHKEIWDDSALVDSWNQALEEYKKYHSMHARGIKLEQLQEEVEASAARRVESTESQAAHFEPTNLISDPEVEENPGGKHIEVATPPQVGNTPNIPGPPPQALLGSVKDENLKKLLMAWYYAGYYTGLFEGGQQAEQQGK